MSERLTSPPTVGVELRKRLSAQRWAATYSHGGSQGFNPLTTTPSPPLHPDDQRKRVLGGCRLPGVAVQRMESASLRTIRAVAHCRPET
jgi:hypothetical protein